MENFKPKEKKLFDLCESFFKEALLILREYITTGVSIPLRTYYEPIARFDKDGKNTGISYVPYEEKDFSYLILKCYKEFENLTQAKIFCEYISEKRYLLIGENTFAPLVLLEEALKDYLKKNNGSFDFQVEEFLNIYTKIEKLIFTNELLFRSTAKLEKFLCAKNIIEFDRNHFIKTYTQEECKEIYHHPSINIYDFTLPQPGDFKIEVLVSKDKNNWGKAGIEGTEEIKRILTTLRLIKDSTIGITTLAVNEPITWFPFTSKYLPSLPPPPIGNSCSIEENEIPDLIDLWKTFESVNLKNCPSLEIAIKRFNYAHEHKTREDSLIDIMIGLESLYMKRNEMDELRFKLSLRAATFLEISMAKDKKTVFDDVNKAYRLRSKVVHGSKVADAEIWECRVIKIYLSDSIKQFTRLSQKHKDDQIIDKIDKVIKSDNKDLLRVLYSQ